MPTSTLFLSNEQPGESATFQSGREPKQEKQENYSWDDGAVGPMGQATPAAGGRPELPVLVRCDDGISL